MGTCDKKATCATGLSVRCRTELREESARIPRRMAPSDYEWWIEQKTQKVDGTVQLTRLLHYGPFPDERSAERQIDELSRTEHYRQVKLVPSKQRRRN